MFSKVLNEKRQQKSPEPALTAGSQGIKKVEYTRLELLYHIIHKDA